LWINAGKRVQDTVCGTSDLQQHLTDTWAGVSQNFIVKAADQWRKWLHACEKAAKERHFKHMLN